MAFLYTEYLSYGAQTPGFGRIATHREKAGGWKGKEFQGWPHSALLSVSTVYCPLRRPSTTVLLGAGVVGARQLRAGAH